VEAKVFIRKEEQNIPTKYPLLFDPSGMTVFWWQWSTAVVACGLVNELFCFALLF
jgi:hypothetical protein